jgi:hypothetical protein
MGKIRVLYAVIALGFMGCSISAPGEPQHTDALNDFLKVLASGTRAARVDYQGSCDLENPNRSVSPDIMLVKANVSKHGLTLARAMLANTRNTTVRESEGVIYVRIGTMDGSILRTGIKLLERVS